MPHLTWVSCSWIGQYRPIHTMLHVQALRKTSNATPSHLLPTSFPPQPLPLPPRSLTPPPLPPRSHPNQPAWRNTTVEGSGACSAARSCGEVLPLPCRAESAASAQRRRPEAGAYQETPAGNQRNEFAHRPISNYERPHLLKYCQRFVGYSDRFQSCNHFKSWSLCMRACAVDLGEMTQNDLKESVSYFLK